MKLRIIYMFKLLCLGTLSCNAMSENAVTPQEIERWVAGITADTTPEYIEEGLNRGIDIGVRATQDFETVLMKSIKAKNTPLAHYLLDNYSEKFNPQNIFLNECIAAVSADQPTIVCKIASMQVDGYYPTHLPHVPVFIFAVEFGESNCLQILKEYGFNVDYINFNGYTALSRAIALQKYDIAIDLLLKCGANPNVPFPSGVSLLIFAIIKNRFDLVQALVGCGADVKVEHKGMFPLKAALFYENTDCLSYLLSLPRVDINMVAEELSPFRDGKTILMSAVAGQMLDKVKFLLSYDTIDFNIQDAFGQTVREYESTPEIMGELNFYAMKKWLIFIEGTQIQKHTTDQALIDAQNSIEVSTKKVLESSDLARYISSFL